MIGPLTARNAEAVIGVAISAFPGHPLAYLAIILGPIVELPILLLIARRMLGLKDRIGGAPAAGRDQA
jgi:ACR3 family arsenite efflux pump ArsB